MEVCGTWDGSYDPGSAFGGAHGETLTDCCFAHEIAQESRREYQIGLFAAAG